MAMNRKDEVLNKYQSQYEQSCGIERGIKSN